MAAERRRPERTPSQSDPDGAIERIVPRRQLRIDVGDVVIRREPGGLRLESRTIYLLQLHGSEPLPDRYATFEHAAAKGEELATQHKVRLFYIEQKAEPPFLLKDKRA
jgi:hypothetical protein